MWSSSRIYFMIISLYPLYKWRASGSQMWTPFICRWCLSNFSKQQIEHQINKNFSLICDWFVENKLSTHFQEDETKSILFSSESKIRKASPLNIQYKEVKIKQYTKVKYSDSILSKHSLANLRPDMLQKK